VVIDYSCSSPDDATNNAGSVEWNECMPAVNMMDSVSNAFAITKMLQIACLAFSSILKTETFRSAETSGYVTSLLRR
jgi:hypothetical protein